LESNWSATLRTKSDQVSKGIKRRELALGIIIVSIVAVISIALTLQGWKSRIPAFDLLTYIYGVRNFLETGALLQHGDTGSYGSYKPPGTAWLMLPSTLLFSDPRLSEYVGTGLLHLSTLVGIFLLARRYFGTWCASLAVILYGLSAHSIFLAGSLWPNGRPDFYVWIVLFTSQWVARRDARYLAAALAVWGLGMYVDLAITPVFFILPAAWLYYKPPLRLKPLLFAGAIVFVVWIPYLRFELTRGFIDIRSQMLQQHIFPANYREAWCDGSLVLQNWEEASAMPVSGQDEVQPSAAKSATPADRLLNAASNVNDKLLYNYEPVAPVPGASILLLLMAFCGLLILSVPGSSPNSVVPLARAPIWRRPILLLATGMIICALLVSGFILAARLFGVDGALQGSKMLLIAKLQRLLLVSGVALLVGIWITSIAGNLLNRMGVHIQPLDRAVQRRLLVLSLLIPWFILLLVAEPGKPERFMWLWPLQSVFLAAFLTYVLPRFRLPRATIWTFQVMVILIVAGNYFLISRMEAWARDGWAGPDAAEIQVVDTIAHQIKAEGKDRSAIGYQTFIYAFMANYNIANPIYKVGAEFDLLFLYRNGITNTNQCAEGVAAGDEFRIVETKPKPPDWSPKEYFSVPRGNDYQLVYQVGSYQVYKRD
jgi:hypothetical protein